MSKPRARRAVTWPTRPMPIMPRRLPVTCVPTIKLGPQLCHWPERTSCSPSLARLAAAKLLTQARIRPDDGVWALITSWVPDFDSWAIADHAMMAGQKRLVADPTRIDQVEDWTNSTNHWTRRAAMVITLPYTKQNHPKPIESAIRERVLGWASAYVHDPEWFIQKSVAWWLRDLSKHDPDRVRAFMAENGKQMKPFARKEAEKFLSN